MTRVEEAAEALGIKLLPWQIELGERFLNGERVVTNRSRRGGMFTLAKVVDHATGVQPFVNQEEREKSIQANEVAQIVMDEHEKVRPGEWVDFGMRYGIADRLWNLGYRRVVDDEPEDPTGAR